MDFGFINRGPHADACFPNLHVLTLISIIFSHEWQINWVASLGRGHLRELYLDDCPILTHARFLQPLERGFTKATNLQTGDVALVSDDIFPRKDYVGENILEAESEYIAKEVRFPGALRWYKVLRRWEEAMPSLR